MPDTAVLIAVIVIGVFAAFAVGGLLGWWLRGKSAAGGEQTRVDMQNAFAALATTALDDNSRRFLEQAGEKFKTLQTTSTQELDAKKNQIAENLSGVTQHLDKVLKQSAKLETTIETNRQTTEHLRADTTRLREVLSSSQQRGQWGERMVSDILQVIGLQEKLNYTRQQQTQSGQRPDFTFNLPHNKRLNMDVKFPLAQYENYLVADNDATRAQAKKTFLAAIKKHIDAVSGREYINPAEGTLDYVMLFIPNESIYGFVNREDAELVDYALQKRVLLCSPLTLYAVLSLIHQATRTFMMGEQISEVLNLVSEFRKQWGKYVDLMNTMGTRITKLKSDYDSLVTTRTNQLEKPLNQLENIKNDDIAATAQLPDTTDSQDD